jgi:hypothetical protein
VLKAFEPNAVLDEVDRWVMTLPLFCPGMNGLQCRRSAAKSLKRVNWAFKFKFGVSWVLVKLPTGGTKFAHTLSNVSPYVHIYRTKGRVIHFACRNTFYTQDQKVGYTDYPFLAEAQNGAA